MCDRWYVYHLSHAMYLCMNIFPGIQNVDTDLPLNIRVFGFEPQVIRTMNHIVKSLGFPEVRFVRTKRLPERLQRDSKKITGFVTIRKLLSKDLRHLSVKTRRRSRNYLCRDFEDLGIRLEMSSE